MSTAPKLPIERAREVIATWNADGTWRERNALNLPGEVDDLADALEALIREHEALTAAFREREEWIDPDALAGLAGHRGLAILSVFNDDRAGEPPREWWVEALGSTNTRHPSAATAGDALKAAEPSPGGDV